MVRAVDRGEPAALFMFFCGILDQVDGAITRIAPMFTDDALDRAIELAHCSPEAQVARRRPRSRGKQCRSRTEDWLHRGRQRTTELRCFVVGLSIEQDPRSDRHLSRRRRCARHRDRRLEPRVIRLGRLRISTLQYPGLLMKNEPSIELSGNLIIARLRGELTEALMRDCQERVLQLVEETGIRNVLYDVLDMLPPSVDVSLAQGRLDVGLGIKIRRAIVVHSSKTAYQARLAFGESDYRIFYNDMNAATRWLSPDPETSAPIHFRTPANVTKKRLSIELSGNLIIVRLRGELTEALLHDCQERMLQLVEETGIRKVLYDVLDMLPPPVEVSLAQGKLDEGLGSNIRRAIVVASSKTAYQARLAFGESDYRVFYDDMMAATRWLSADGETAS